MSIDQSSRMQHTERVEPPLGSANVGRTIAWLLLIMLAVAGYRLASTARMSTPAAHVPLAIDLNQATDRELSLLPGVGTVLAKRIVDDRAEQGPFRSAAEIGRVRGVGEKSIARFSQHLYVEGVSIAKLAPPARFPPRPRPITRPIQSPPSAPLR